MHAGAQFIDMYNLSNYKDLVSVTSLFFCLRLDIKVISNFLARIAG